MALYLTPREVSERWNCSASHVRRLCRTGELPAMRLGLDSWRISVAAVTEHERRQTTTATDATDRVAMRQTASHKEVTHTTTVDGFTLPADYEPVFGDLWPGHVPAKKKAAVSSQRDNR